MTFDFPMPWVAERVHAPTIVKPDWIRDAESAADLSEECGEVADPENVRGDRCIGYFRHDDADSDFYGPYGLEACTVEVRNLLGVWIDTIGESYCVSRERLDQIYPGWAMQFNDVLETET